MYRISQSQKHLLKISMIFVLADKYVESTDIIPYEKGWSLFCIDPCFVYIETEKKDALIDKISQSETIFIFGHTDQRVVGSKRHHLKVEVIQSALRAAGISIVRVYQHGIKEPVINFEEEDNSKIISVLSSGWDILLDIGISVKTPGFIPLFKSPDRTGFRGNMFKYDHTRGETYPMLGFLGMEQNSGNPKVFGYVRRPINTAAGRSEAFVRIYPNMVHAVKGYMPKKLQDPPQTVINLKRRLTDLWEVKNRIVTASDKLSGLRLELRLAARSYDTIVTDHLIHWYDPTALLQKVGLYNKDYLKMVSVDQYLEQLDWVENQIKGTIVGRNAMRISTKARKYYYELLSFFGGNFNQAILRQGITLQFWGNPEPKNVDEEPTVEEAETIEAITVPVDVDMDLQKLAEIKRHLRVYPWFKSGMFGYRLRNRKNRGIKGPYQSLDDMHRFVLEHFPDDWQTKLDMRRDSPFYKPQ